MIDLQHVETPVGLVDLDRARRNSQRVVEYAAKHGLGWRPHIKTHKSLEIARIQLDAGAKGLTVATLREAEVMAELTDDILLAYPQVGRAKLERLVALPEHIDLKVALDSEEALRPMAEIARAHGRSIGVLVEEDVGMGRVGLSSADEVLGLAARVVETPGVDFRGILFYPGHIRMKPSDQDDHLRSVASRVQLTLSALRDHGMEPEIVSGGSTPTLWRSHDVPGLTEIRSGSCIYFDREGLDIGVAHPDDVAYTVLATVVSTAIEGCAVIDAGSKALAKESRGSGEGFGVLFEHPDVRVASVSEEHGVLSLGDSDWVPQVGDRVRVIPNHVCVSVNLHDRLVGSTAEGCSWVGLEGRGRGTWSK